MVVPADGAHNRLREADFTSAGHAPAEEYGSMSRIFSFIYGAASYVLCLATFVYAIGFIGNFGVSGSLDSAAAGPWQTALLIDLGLLSLFAIQHSVMARPAFKRMLTRIVPAAIERSTYVLASCAAMLFLFWQWRSLGGTVWDFRGGFGEMMLYAGYAFGWVLVLVATMVINHFDLFGLRQVWRNLLGKPQSGLPFETPFLYRIVRHPLYVGWLCVFWCTPVMTVTHLVFAIVTTAYIFVAIQFEERDLMAQHPEYAEYRKQVPMIVPGLPQRVSIPQTSRARSGAAV
jgi:protein-S-isoprenylcysteine O-methyltransferase Ste14